MINVTQKMSKSWSMRKKNKPFLQQTCGDYINDGFIPFSWACSTVSSIVHARSLTWLTGTLKGMEPSSTLLVTPVLFLLWQQECLSTVWAIDLHTHMHTHTYTHTHTQAISAWLSFPMGLAPEYSSDLCECVIGSFFWINLNSCLYWGNSVHNRRTSKWKWQECHSWNTFLCNKWTALFLCISPPSSECGAKGQVDLKNKKGKMF